MSAIEKFISKPFSGDTSQFRDFEAEIKEVLQSTNPLAVQFLFPTVPWTLDAHHLPTNLDTEDDLVYYPGIRIPDSGGMTLGNYQVAYSEWTAKSKQNEKIKDSLMMLRKTLSSRLGPTFLTKLQDINNNLLLYHFWCEIKLKHGYATISVQTQGKHRINCQAKHQPLVNLI